MKTASTCQTSRAGVARVARRRPAGNGVDGDNLATLSHACWSLCQDERLTIDEVATAYRTPIATLRYWRARGEGPRSFRLGRRVFYRKQAYDAWVDAAHARQSVGGVA